MALESPYNVKGDAIIEMHNLDMPHQDRNKIITFLSHYD